MTNFERIKAMSVEEMADLLQVECCYCTFLHNGCAQSDEADCHRGTVQWLNKEAEEWI